MADEILRKLAPDLTLEQLQETLCAAERQLKAMTSASPLRK